MATTIIIEGKKVTGTVTEKEVVVGGKSADVAAVNVKTIGMDENAVPTNIRFRSEWSQAKTIDLFTRIVNYKRAFIDQINAIDQFTRIVNYNRIVPETVRVSQETTTFKVNSLKTDRINTGDSLLKSVRRDAVVDAVNVNGKFVAKSFKLNTSVDFANVLEKIYLTPKPLKTDSSIFTDNFTRVLNWYRTFTDNIRITDDYLGNANIDDDQYATFIKTISINVNVLEFATKQIKVVNIDQINVAENSLKTTTLQKTDSWTATDQFSRQVGYIRAQTDPVNAGENNLKTISKFSVDSNNITDTNLVKDITNVSIDTTNTTETVYNFASKALLHIINSSDSLYINSGLALTTQGNVQDNNTITANSVSTDTSTASDQSTSSIQPSISITTNISEILVKDINIVSSDISNVLETKYFNINIPKSNSFNITDTNFNSIELLKSDAISYPLETVTKSINSSYLQHGNISEYIGKNVVPGVNETIQLNDTPSKFTNLLKTDLVNIKDSFTRTVDYLRIFEENNAVDYLVLENLLDYLLLENGNFLTTEIYGGVRYPLILLNDLSVSFNSSIFKTNASQITDSIVAIKYIAYAISQEDLLNITDSAVFLNIGLLSTSAANTTETVYNVTNKTLIDQINITDDYLGLANIDDDQYASFGKSTINSINIIELIGKNISSNLQTDQSNVQDNNTITANSVSTDISTASDQSTSSIQPSISITTNISEILVKDISIVSSDISNVLETKYFNINIPKSNSFNITDTTPVKDITSVSIDTTNTTDNFSIIVDYLRTFQEYVFSEYLVLENLSDYLVLENGDFLITQSYPRIILNDFNIKVTIDTLKSEISNALSTPYLNLKSLKIDTTNFTDTITTTVTTTTTTFNSQEPLDITSVSSSGTAYWQDYFVDPFYVEPAYTGSLTTFT